MGALAALVPAYGYLAGRAAISGFSAYLSLIASDGSALMHSWQTFGLAVLESAPIAGCALGLGILMVAGLAGWRALHGGAPAWSFAAAFFVLAGFALFAPIAT